jgi:hypothetical protein
VNERSTLVVGGVILALALGIGGWIYTAQPDDASIQARLQAPPPLPEVNLQLLEQAGVGSRTKNGTLPIEVNLDTLGRDDPFAGT